MREKNPLLKKLQLAAAAGGTLLLAACAADYNDGKLQQGITFSEPAIVDLPSGVRNSEKRGFIDLNGDGLEDMIQINDTAWIGTKYVAEVYPGIQDTNGFLTFSPNSYKVTLPLQHGWFSGAFKFDTADVNGDQLGDLVLTETRKSLFGSINVTAKMAIQQKDGSFKFAEEKSTSKERYTLEKAIRRGLDRAMDTYGVADDYRKQMKIDWADFDGDGRDDMILFWKDGADVSSDIYFTQPDQTFVSTTATKIPGLIADSGYKIKQIDTEDFNGDGKADIVAFKYSGDTYSLRVVFGDVKPGYIGFKKQAEFKGKCADLDFVGFEKRDHFDANGDGLADYAHLGKMNGKPVVCYAFAKLAKPMAN